MGVELVDDGQVGIQAVQRAPFGRFGLKSAVRRLDIKRVRQYFKAKMLAKGRSLLRHALSVAENNAGLVSGCGERINLGARLMISQQAVERNAR